MTLEELSASISDDQRVLLNEIWSYRLLKDSWLPVGVLYRKFGKAEVISRLRLMGGSIAFLSSNAGERDRFVLTFLGILLTDNGARLALMFIQYLEYLKKCLENDWELKTIKGSDVEKQLQLDKSEAKAFVTALQLSPFMNGGGFSEDSWSVGLPLEIDDVVSEIEVLDYFQSKALGNYDPRIPLEGGRRIQYLDHRGLDTDPRIELTEEERGTAETPITTYDIFLSYASGDSKEAGQIYQSIIAVGGKAFLSEKSLKAGDDFAEEIRKALHESTELWLLLSPNSLKSEWVISEWGAAWALRKRIIPILFRCAITEAPERIQRLHCIDFHEYHELIEERFPDNASGTPVVPKTN